jgi:hypothetical protein
MPVIIIINNFIQENTKDYIIQVEGSGVEACEANINIPDFVHMARQKATFYHDPGGSLSSYQNPLR